MAETVDNLSGDEREERIAALKAKMQASARERQTEQPDEEADATTAEAPATTDDVAENVVDAPAADASGAEADEAVAVADAAADVDADADDAADAADSAESDHVDVAGNGAAAPATNGATNGAGAAAVASTAAPAPVIEGRVEEEEDEEAVQKRYYNRREFMVYAWGAATGLLLAESGVASYLFMYPRFRAGEFGGNFYVDASALPTQEDAPQGYTDGKFWLVETEEGEPKALYMVCTHLGCLYKWEPANWRFECPCHGSKFTHDGFYIEGPAPRSLDYFEITDEGDQLAVNTGRKITGDPSAESPARAAPA